MQGAVWGSGEDLGKDLGFHSLTHLVHLCTCVTNPDPVMQWNLYVNPIITHTPSRCGASWEVLPSGLRIPRRADVLGSGFIQP